jgi:hypothetical protein
VISFFILMAIILDYTKNSGQGPSGGSHPIFEYGILTTGDLKQVLSVFTTPERTDSQPKSEFMSLDAFHPSAVTPIDAVPAPPVRSNFRKVTPLTPARNKRLMEINTANNFSYSHNGVEAHVRHPLSVIDVLNDPAVLANSPALTRHATALSTAHPSQSSPKATHFDLSTIRTKSPRVDVAGGDLELGAVSQVLAPTPVKVQDTMIYSSSTGASKPVIDFSYLSDFGFANHDFDSITETMNADQMVPTLDNAAASNMFQPVTNALILEDEFSPTPLNIDLQFGISPWAPTPIKSDIESSDI